VRSRPRIPVNPPPLALFPDAGYDFDMSWIENRFEEGVIVTSLDFFINWGARTPFGR
jgi:hypothetical protein